MDMNYVFGILISVIGFFLRDFWMTAKQLRVDVDSNKETISVVNSKLEVLTRDNELKHTHLSEKFDSLSESMRDLTREIKELSKELKKKD